MKSSTGIHETKLERSNFPQPANLIGRWRCLEILLIWEGGIRTNVLTHIFGISRNRASALLSRYKELHPDNLRYDRNLKMYQPSAQFTAAYATGTEAEYVNILKWLHLWNDALVDMAMETPGLETMSFPQPNTNRDHFQTVLWATRCRRVVDIVQMDIGVESGKIEYIRRTVAPQVMVRTHLGWHVRVYESGVGFDLIRLNRLYSVSQMGEKAGDVPRDSSWEKTCCLIGSPRKENLTEEEFALVSIDWGVTGMRPLSVYVREPLVGIVLHYWQRIDDRLSFSVSVMEHDHWMALA